jgi:hypothetical protein
MITTFGWLPDMTEDEIHSAQRRFEEQFAAWQRDEAERKKKAAPPRTAGRLRGPSTAGSFGGGRPIKAPAPAPPATAKTTISSIALYDARNGGGESRAAPATTGAIYAERNGCRPAPDDHLPPARSFGELANRIYAPAVTVAAASPSRPRSFADLAAAAYGGNATVGTELIGASNRGGQ